MEEIVIEKIKKLNISIKQELAKINFDSINEAKSTIKNYSQLQIVMYLLQHKEKVVFQKDIGEAIHLKKSSITEHLDYLESIDVIKRVGDQEDNRRKRIILSNKALEFEHNFVATVSELNNRMLEGIEQSDIELFVKVIDMIEKNIKGDDK